jgi:hypothetical protein
MAAFPSPQFKYVSIYVFTLVWSHEFLFLLKTCYYYYLFLSQTWSVGPTSDWFLCPFYMFLEDFLHNKKFPDLLCLPCFRCRVSHFS